MLCATLTNCRLLKLNFSLNLINWFRFRKGFISLRAGDKWVTRDNKSVVVDVFFLFYDRRLSALFFFKITRGSKFIHHHQQQRESERIWKMEQAMKVKGVDAVRIIISVCSRLMNDLNANIDIFICQLKFDLLFLAAF